MELGETIRRRRMVRRYRAEAVDPAALRRILDRARQGPSAGFTQGVHLVVVQDERTRTRLASICRENRYVARGYEPWLSTAPVHVIPCVAPGEYRARYDEPDKASSRGPAGWAVPFWHVDGGAALMLLLLATVDEGLAAGFIDLPDHAAVRDLLGIPDDVVPLGLATIGHAAPDPRAGSRARGRRPLEEVVHSERW